MTKVNLSVFIYEKVKCSKVTFFRYLIFISFFLVPLLNFAQGNVRKAARQAFNFAYCGYATGCQLPARSYNLPFFNVTDFGAIPNDGLDDVAAIQRAVDAAAAAGGGVVKFPKGKFDFALPGNDNFVKVTHSNIVLQGHGEGNDGTLLIDHYPSVSEDESKMWLSGKFPAFFKIRPHNFDEESQFNNERKLALVASAKQGATTLRVKTGVDKISPGKMYVLTMQESSDTSLAYMLNYPQRKLARNILSKEGDDQYKFRQYVKVLAVKGNELTVEQPICIALQDKWLPTLWQTNELLENVGVENFRMISHFEDVFVHHFNSAHDNGYDHIKLNGVYNSWVRNTVHINASTAVGLINAVNCVVYNCRIEGKMGHNGFLISGKSTANLFFNLLGGNHLHTFSVNGYASGNVFYNCYSDEPSAIDCHGVRGVNNLFDGIKGAVLRSGGSSENAPPHHARGLIIWNWTVGLTEPYKNIIYPVMERTGSYPSSLYVGVKGLRGQTIFFRTNDGLKYSDFNDGYAKAIHLNQTKKLSIPSLFIWQRSKRFKQSNLLFE
jgi:hypothetical protein